MKKEVQIAINLLQTTLGSMPSEKADKIVAEVINILNLIKS